MPHRPPALLTAALAGHYRIERELGAGGMATVYLAEDLKHGREVAIKVLRSDVARSITGERFLREIAITAKLNHPHVLALLDSGAAGDGELLYYVMPLATGESLRERLDREGTMPIADAVRLGGEIADALAHAHERGLVHRDIKPANVLLSGGHAVVADFGVAKAVGHARTDETLTMTGLSIGTPAYMAPEQGTGEANVDHRADIYALGLMLYEMCTGELPFKGEHTLQIVEKLTRDAPPLAAGCASAPRALQQLVAQCLARDPAERPQTAEQVRRELTAIGAELSAPRMVSSSPAARKTPLLVAGLAAMVGLAGLLTVLYMRERSGRFTREVALPAIARYIEEDKLDSAFAMAEEVDRRSPGDTALGRVWPEVSLEQSFLSEPEGASVSRASLSDTTRWIPIGTTPTKKVRIPTDAWFYRYEKPGYRTVTIMGALMGGSYVPIPSPVALRKVTDPDSDMVLLRGAGLVGTLYGLPPSDKFNLSDFLMDKQEVTNRQYRAFVNAGGYSDRKYWDTLMVRDGTPVTWEAAVSTFVDRTGRPGPAMWEGGAPPPDADELPVGGVSWYEARAYARFVGKELPTVVEWNAAAMPEAARWVVPNGRYESTGPVRGGAERNVSARGVYDLAGNVREWTVNEREPGNRFILGGGWSDPPYLFAEIYSQPQFDRSPINGIRLVKRLTTSPDLTAASAPIAGRGRRRDAAQPVDDATFRGLLALYDYDRVPADPKLVSRDTTPADWTREDVTIAMPKSGERLPLAVFIPKHARPPYQTIVIWPASDAFLLRDSQKLSLWFVDYLLRGGRAVIYPIYEHTYGRGTSRTGDVRSATIEHRDQMIRWATEMRRSIDYAGTRADLDTSRLAYVGTSWGGRIASVMLAIEPRIRTAILNVAGLSAAEVRPEEYDVNFLPRIRIPVLMLSGKFDSVFPYESSQKPFYELLGSPPGKKKQIVFDGGHFIPRTALVAESLKWLDAEFGPVKR